MEVFYPLTTPVHSHLLFTNLASSTCQQPQSRCQQGFPAFQPSHQSNNAAPMILGGQPTHTGIVGYSLSPLHPLLPFKSNSTLYFV